MFNIFKKKWEGNQIMVLTPYKVNGVWRFDDKRTNLKGEAFILGIDRMINIMVHKKQIPNPEDGFTLTFSHEGFPGADIRLVRLNKEKKGWWYYSNMLDIKGWLCPALFKYFPVAPENIYAGFTPLVIEQKEGN